MEPLGITVLVCRYDYTELVCPSLLIREPLFGDVFVVLAKTPSVCAPVGDIVKHLGAQRRLQPFCLCWAVKLRHYQLLSVLVAER